MNDAVRKMELNNVVAKFDYMYDHMKARFDGKTWEDGRRRIGLYPEYVMKKWLNVAIKRGDVVVFTNNGGIQIFQFVQLEKK